VLSSYQAGGHLLGMTVADLAELYRAEGVELGLPEAPDRPVPHLLEGGQSLAPPLAGTAGFMRLFGQPHGPYQPQSQAVRDLISSSQSLTQQVPP